MTTDNVIALLSTPKTMDSDYYRLVYDAIRRELRTASKSDDPLEVGIAVCDELLMWAEIVKEELRDARVPGPRLVLHPEKPKAE